MRARRSSTVYVSPGVFSWMRYAAPIPEIPAPMISTSEYSASVAVIPNPLWSGWVPPYVSAVERVDDPCQRLDGDRTGLVDADPVGDSRHPVADVRGDLGGAAAGRDGVQHVVVDQTAPVRPAAPLGQLVLVGVQGAPAAAVEDGAGRGG